MYRVGGAADGRYVFYFNNHSMEPGGAQERQFRKINDVSDDHFVESDPTDSTSSNSIQYRVYNTRA